MLSALAKHLAWEFEARSFAGTLRMTCDANLNQAYHASFANSRTTLPIPFSTLAIFS